MKKGGKHPENPMLREVFRAVRTQPPEGLGDSLATIFQKFGVKPCKGCKKRKEKLNKAFPYKKKEPEK